MFLDEGGHNYGLNNYKWYEGGSDLKCYKLNLDLSLNLEGPYVDITSHQNKKSTFTYPWSKVSFCSSFKMLVIT